MEPSNALDLNGAPYMVYPVKGFESLSPALQGSIKRFLCLGTKEPNCPCSSCRSFPEERVTHLPSLNKEGLENLVGLFDRIPAQPEVYILEGLDLLLPQMESRLLKLIEECTTWSRRLLIVLAPSWGCISKPLRSRMHPYKDLNPLPKSGVARRKALSKESGLGEGYKSAIKFINAAIEGKTSTALAILQGAAGYDFKEALALVLADIGKSYSELYLHLSFPEYQEELEQLSAKVGPEHIEMLLSLFRGNQLPVHSVELEPRLDHIQASRAIVKLAPPKRSK